eukprot:351377-Chlamydomonas_euryale.AAC.5
MGDLKAPSVGCWLHKRECRTTCRILADHTNSVEGATTLGSRHGAATALQSNQPSHDSDARCVHGFHNCGSRV